MNVEDFDYELPGEAIAQEPAARRDTSRLLVLGSGGSPPEHRAFTDLPGILRPGDLLVLNDTQVIPARLLGTRPTGGRAEVLLLEAVSGASEWRCLVRSSRGPRVGESIRFDEGLRGTILGRDDDGWSIRLEHLDRSPEVMVDRIGRMPVPPYIRRARDDRRLPLDRERYQTVYARDPGAVAAPTAGLHFTRELMDRLARNGVRLAFLTLHVGPGTFQPVRVRRVEDHAMHEERFRIPSETADAIRAAREDGGRVVAVGTTVVRTLEDRFDGREVVHGTGRCGLFIYPGYRFAVVDAMITNFHLPRSTLLMLVSAFSGRERILEAYRVAVEKGYRFYSYGDATLLER